MDQAQNAWRIEPAHVGEFDRLNEICVSAAKNYGYDDETLVRFQPALTPSLALIAAGLMFVARENDEKAFGVMGIRPTQYGGLALLDRVFVAPERQGTGVGRKLFEKAVTQAGTMQSTAILIYSHPLAEGFYQRLGAVRVGQTPFYLSADLLMPMMVYSL